MPKSKDVTTTAIATPVTTEFQWETVWVSPSYKPTVRYAAGVIEALLMQKRFL